MDNYRVQSVLINNNDMTLDEATDWIVNNKFKLKKVDITENFFRYRQFNPQYIEKLGFTEYIIKKISNKPLIELVIAYQN